MRRPTAKIATLATTGLLTSMLGVGALASATHAAPSVVAPSVTATFVAGPSAAVPDTTRAAEATQVKIKLVKLKKRPGKIRVVNQSDFPVGFAWGHAERHKADGRVRLAEKSSRVIRVRRTAIVWIAMNKTPGATDADIGYLRGIKLPKGQKPLPPSPRL